MAFKNILDIYEDKDTAIVNAYNQLENKNNYLRYYLIFMAIFIFFNLICILFFSNEQDEEMLESTGLIFGLIICYLFFLSKKYKDYAQLIKLYNIDKTKQKNLSNLLIAKKNLNFYTSILFIAFLMYVLSLLNFLNDPEEFFYSRRKFRS